MATIITTDDQKPAPPARTWGLAKALFTLCVVIITFVLVCVYGAQIKARLGKIDPTIIIATAQVANPPAPRVYATTMPRQERAPALSLEQINATSIAIYQATVAAVEQAVPIENVGHTGASAPVFSKPVEREPAGEIVPTSLPIEPAAQNGHGSKVVVVDVQADKACLHGQVWTERGCKNPTAVVQP